MPSQTELHTWREREVTDVNGEPLGHAEALYNDDRTGEPAFILVRGGRFGNKMHFAPVDGATLEGDVIRLAYEAEQVNGAPRVSADEHLSADEERRLFAHYGLEGAPDASSTVIVLSRWVLVE
jgi:PRC-barrel domain